MKYIAKPIAVEAYKILRVGTPSLDAARILELEGGRGVIADAAMTARMDPKPGDYYVIQEDGYIYLNPAAVFERKYAPAMGNAPIAQTDPPTVFFKNPVCRGSYALGSACGNCERCHQERMNQLAGASREFAASHSLPGSVRDL